MSIVRTDNLTKYYGRTRGVEDISLAVEERDIFGFIGPNGAGKSTLIRLLLNFIIPTSGSASIFGFNVVKSSKNIKELTGYVPSDVRLYKNMKVDDLLFATMAFHNITASDELDRLCILFEIERQKHFSQLSSGNKKKIALVAALLGNPKLLILDEPTNGLDPVMQNILFSELIARCKNGLTIFMSSHNLHEIEKYCTRAAFIKEGRIINLLDLNSTAQPVKKITLWNLKNPEILFNIGASLTASEGDKTQLTFQGAGSLLSKAILDCEMTDYTIENISLRERFLKSY